MALLNGIYIHVTDESINTDIEVSDHPIEQGADVTDHINIKGTTISLSGKIVATETMTGDTILRNIQKWRDSKTLLKYEGRNHGNNLVISKFSTSHPNTIAGGCEFEMELRQLRIAKSGYVASKSTSSKAKTTNKISVGSTVVFKGGSVYRSSDAPKKAATRGRSTCRVTKISRKNWSVHQIHLISTDGAKVYGWVDESNIEGVNSANTVTKKATNAGRQQISTGKFSAVQFKE